MKQNTLYVIIRFSSIIHLITKFFIDNKNRNGNRKEIIQLLSS